MHKATTVLAAICCALPASAADLPGLMRSRPVLVRDADIGMYDLERCILSVDQPNLPFVYRQPDRPAEELVVWDGTGGGLGGVAAAARIEGVERATLTFWGREKFLRRIETCVGLRDPG